MTDVPHDPRSIHVNTDPSPQPTVVPAGAPPEVQPVRRGPRRRRFGLGSLVLTLLAILIIAGMLLAGMAWSSWRGVERVDLESVLVGSDGGTNYLVVGTDSRDGVAADAENAGLIFGEGIAGERTDTIAVLRVEDGVVSLLAIPRDLYLPIDGGSPSRINAAFARGGPASLARTIQAELGIGIDHYLEVDFAGFLGLVDALGGVTIDLPFPARDPKSGLDIPQAGPVELDSAMALAYVRSRNYIELVDGQERRDPTADLGRVQRQQKFLGALFAELGTTVNPFTMLDALDAVADNVRVDSGLSLRDAARLGLAVRGASPGTATVPTTRFITDAGADVLLLDAGAGEVLAPFRS